MPNITLLEDTGGLPLTPQQANDNVRELDRRTAEGWQNLSAPLEVDGVLNAATTVSFGGVPAHSFEPTNNNYAGAKFNIPHGYVDGSDVYPHVHFTIDQPGDGVVRFGFTYRYAKEYVHGGDNTYARYSDPVTQYVEVTLDAGDLEMQMIAEVGTPLNSPGITKDSVILMSIFRDASHVNDTFPYPVIITQADLYVRMQGFGTATR